MHHWRTLRSEWPHKQDPEWAELQEEGLQFPLLESHQLVLLVPFVELVLHQLPLWLLREEEHLKFLLDQCLIHPACEDHRV